MSQFTLTSDYHKNRIYKKRTTLTTYILPIALLLLGYGGYEVALQLPRYDNPYSVFNCEATQVSNYDIYLKKQPVRFNLCPQQSVSFILNPNRNFENTSIWLKKGEKISIMLPKGIYAKTTNTPYYNNIAAAEEGSINEDATQRALLVASIIEDLDKNTKLDLSNNKNSQGEAFNLSYASDGKITLQAEQNGYLHIGIPAAIDSERDGFQTYQQQDIFVKISRL